MGPRVVWWGLLVGCGGGGGAPGHGQASVGGVSTESETAGAMCDEASPGPAPIRPLTGEQLNHTLEDLFGYVVWEGGYQPAVIDDGYRTFAEHNLVSAVGANALMENAEAFAEWYDGELSSELPCALEPGDTTACLEGFVDEVGAKLFRRPLSESERKAFLGLALDAPSSADGVGWVLEAMLQSPQFLYLDLDPGIAVEGNPGVERLSDHALASRLSYALWNRPPDAELLDAAVGGALSTREEVGQQARRLLADPRAADSLAAFHSDWLRLYRLGRSLKDPDAFPSFGYAQLDAMQASFDATFDWMVQGGDTHFEELLTGTEVHLNPELGWWLGVDLDGPEDQFVRVQMDDRAGVLTHPAFLTAHAHSIESAPILRGVVVLRQLLCTELTVPDDVEPLPDVPSQSGEATVRERLAEHREDPSCAACHDSIDPLGLAFEHYDAVGAYRDAYTGGQPVDATGTVDALDVDITDAIDLAYALATADDVRDCYQRHAFRYAHGRRETEGDACALSGVEEAFSGGDIIELLVAIASSDSFRFRPAPEEAR